MLAFGILKIQCLNANIGSYKSISYDYGYNFESVTFYNNISCNPSNVVSISRIDGGCNYNPTERKDHNAIFSGVYQPSPTTIPTPQPVTLRRTLLQQNLILIQQY